MGAPANGSLRELGRPVAGSAGASSRFNHRNAAQDETSSVPQDQAGSQASEDGTPADNFDPYAQPGSHRRRADFREAGH